MHFTGRTAEKQESIFKNKITGIKQLQIWIILDVDLYADDFRFGGHDAA
jgi:hypothetical protein